MTVKIIPSPLISTRRGDKLSTGSIVPEEIFGEALCRKLKHLLCTQRKQPRGTGENLHSF
jgi:hypothetical protein